MVKSKCALLTIAVLLLSVIAVTNLQSAPGDVVITLVIPAAKVADFSAGFLAKCPIPLIYDPTWIPDPNDYGLPPQIPEYTPKQWIKEWLRRQAVRAYRHGKIKLAQDAAIADPNVIQ